MPLAADPSASRGKVVLQPSYFTSSLFVQPLREDITNLINTFHDEYTQTQPTQPFTLFKNIWRREWMWMHFMVFDSRSRDTFLGVTMRLFLERMVKTEPPFNRVVALFGLYTFFFTQPSESSPPLHCVEYIPIPSDHYASLSEIPGALTTAYLLPLQRVAAYTLSTLLEAQVFHILPSSELGPLNPRELPREVFIPDDSDIPGPEASKKGRPSKREKVKRAKDALANLEKRLEKKSYSPEALPGCASTSTSAAHNLLSNRPKMTLLQYQAQKSRLLNTIDPPYPENATTTTEGRAALEQANRYVLERLIDMDAQAVDDSKATRGDVEHGMGIERVQNVIAELSEVDFVTRQSWGLLGLLEDTQKR